MGVPKLWHTEMIEVYETLLAYNQAMPSPPSAIEDGENLPSILTIRYTRKVRNYQKGMISLVELCVPSSIYSVSNWMDWILLMWCLWCILNVCLLSEWIGSWHCLKTISRKLNFFFFGLFILEVLSHDYIDVAKMSNSSEISKEWGSCGAFSKFVGFGCPHSNSLDQVRTTVIQGKMTAASRSQPDQFLPI